MKNKITLCVDEPAKDEWGPAYWLFLHRFAASFTVDKRKVYKHFIKKFGSVIPCVECRGEYNAIIRSLKEKDFINILKNRKTLARFFFTLHNKINKRLGKKNFLCYNIIKNIVNIKNGKRVDHRRGEGAESNSHERDRSQGDALLDEEKKENKNKNKTLTITTTTKKVTSLSAHQASLRDGQFVSKEVAHSQ